MESDKDKVTTLRVRTSTRDAIKVLADKRKVSVEDLILQLAQKDTSKQILVTVDMKNYDMMMHLARLLKNTNYMNSDRLDDMLIWCFDYTMREVRSHIDKNILPPQSTQQGMYSQPQGGQTA